MTVIRKSVMLMFAMSTTVTVHAAELDGLIGAINKFKKNVEASAKKNQSSNTDPKQTTNIVPSSLAVKTSEEYCTKLLNNPLVNEFANTVSTLPEVMTLPRSAVLRTNSGSRVESIKNYLDTEDRLLTQWIAKVSNGDSSQIAQVGLWANECLYKNKTSNLPYAFAIDQSDKDKLVNRMKDYEKNGTSKSTKREVDINGNIITDEPMKSLPAFLSLPTAMADINANPQWAAALAVALPNGEEVMQKLSSDIPKNLKIAGDKYKADEVAKQAKSEQEAKANEIQKQAEANKAKQAELAEKSPDRQLFRAYRLFYRLDQCQKARVGYKAVFINDVEYTTAKTKIKAIETKLKPSLTQTTDAIWTKATSTEYEYMDVNGIKLVADYSVKFDPSNTEYPRAYSACREFKLYFDDTALEILGQAPAQKNF